jgi:hypothetical protein
MRDIIQPGERVQEIKETGGKLKIFQENMRGN